MLWKTQFPERWLGDNLQCLLSRQKNKCVTEKILMHRYYDEKLKIPGDTRFKNV